MTRPAVLVTGAGKRVGRAVALELAGAGLDVAIHYGGSRAEALEVGDEARALGVDADVFQADLGERSQVRELARAVSERFPHLAAVVNNASSFEPVPLEQIDDAGWNRMLEVNLAAPFFLSQALLPALRQGRLPGAPEGQGGVIVHLCDIGADRPVSGYAHYSVSKAGLVMLVKAMAVELGPVVRCVGVSPGQVAWPETYPEELRERIRRRIPLRRVGVPEDVARVVRFLILEGHYLDGIVVPVDGGLGCRY